MSVINKINSNIEYDVKMVKPDTEGKLQKPEQEDYTECHQGLAMEEEGRLQKEEKEDCTESECTQGITIMEQRVEKQEREDDGREEGEEVEEEE